VFYGLLGHGYPAAFGSSVAQLGGLLLVVAVLALSLLRPATGTPGAAGATGATGATRATTEG
jgi:hypothetical protein